MVLLAAVEAAMQAEEEVPVAAAAAVTATPSCKAVWPVSSTAASITAHTKAPPAQEAAALAAWLSFSVDTELLRRPFGIYLLLSGVSLILPQKRKEKRKNNPGG